MRTLGNIIWFIFGGLPLGLSWALVGVLWCITIIGIPIGKQCFKIAEVAFFPFKKDVRLSSSAPSLILNVLWIVFGGAVLAFEAIVVGAIFYITIIGIPFGMQCFKLAKVALLPFGADVVHVRR
ncbi:MAG: YccF domain-containing protein [Coriobacteriia bacterium]|nr:YccF domain-containing protein [Coriobacteriia bacterium]